MEERTYGFAAGGIYVDGIYAAVGDAVKAGDLLAELDRKDILSDIEDAKTELKKREAELERAGDTTAADREAFVLEELEKQLATLTENARIAERDVPVVARDNLLKEIKEQKKKLADTRDNHAFALDFAAKQVLAAAQKIRILEQMAAERAIYAGIDGMVTYAKAFGPKDRSVEDERVITVSDASESVYIVTGSGTELFEPGNVYPLKIGADGIPRA
ncbi:hypothetical protein FACS1894191_4660 [Clostridia bacterium]|nr:hypothetical protein FACS1894191_4660 [Clostridia bacterium]